MVLFSQGINISESNNSLRRGCSSVTFKTWVRFPSAPPREHMSELVSFLEKREHSFLERLPSHQRMTAREKVGKDAKKRVKPKQERHEHFQKDWDKDLWD